MGNDAQALMDGPMLTPQQRRRLTPSRSGRSDETPRGYAGAPEKGPSGETCKTCCHAAVKSTRASGGNYWGCALMKRRWTGGPKTDIRLKSPACDKWEAENDR